MAREFVINSIRCYITTAGNSHTSDALISACQAFYTAEEIYCAKEALYVDVRETLVKRKGKDRIKNYSQDMLLLLHNFDEE